MNDPLTEIALRKRYQAETWKAWSECLANLMLTVLYLAVIGTLIHLVRKLLELQ